MHPAYATLVRHFDRCRLNYQLRVDLQAAHALIAVENAWYSVMVQIDTALSLCEVFVLAQPTIPASRLAALAEAVCRINFTVASGRFDLDFDSRQFRFHNSHHFLGADLTETEIAHVLGQSLQTMDRHYSQLLRIAFGENSSHTTVFTLRRSAPEPSRDAKPGPQP